jgi:hypothetical protein
MIPTLFCGILEQECAMCNSEVEGCYKGLECGHQFHPLCLDELLLVMSACPVCGYSVTRYH